MVGIYSARLSEQRNTAMMKLVKKLDNPFFLGAQGFLLGAVLFWSNAAQESQTPQPVEYSSAYQLPQA